MVWRAVILLSFILTFGLVFPVSGISQRSSKPDSTQAAQPSAETPDSGEEAQEVPGDWGPELLYGILSSPNEEAQSTMLRATFAAGPSIIPQLIEALKDDRTAEYAAQALAFIGGKQALDALWDVLTDPRDLNLRRFTYGALAEYDSPQATDLLMDAISRSDTEPDRTVTEAAVIALTVHSDPKLLPRLKAIESKLQDIVIRDDLDNARAVIEVRAKYLASPEGKKTAGSVESAVRTYFIPALEAPPSTGTAIAPRVKTAGTKAASLQGRAPPKPQASVEIQSVTLTPDKFRALARVVFEDPAARAYYDIVLQKRLGDWTIASVWLGREVEKPSLPSVTSLPGPKSE